MLHVQMCMIGGIKFVGFVIIHQIKFYAKVSCCTTAARWLQYLKLSSNLFPELVLDVGNVTVKCNVQTEHIWSRFLNKTIVVNSLSNYPSAVMTHISQCRCIHYNTLYVNDLRSRHHCFVLTLKITKKIVLNNYMKLKS